ncbi:MAG: FAD:protein FMN transferase [Bacteroidales bacterium]|jgi:thiamine biosynthesis lipoprotein|nr:FAD:protein FMN transferase [Bacteroidales bacterium]MCK9499104.1 FAD:protein FMN transferase [Bacteroidales bacterium]
MRNLIYLLILILLFSCTNKSKNQYQFYKGEIHGTYFHITYQSSFDLSMEIDSVFKVFNASLNNYDPNSLISKINFNEENQTDSLFRIMFYKAKQVYEESDGAFDISIAPIVNEWGFGWIKKDKNNIPDSSKIENLLNFVGMDKWSIVDNKIVKDCQEAMLISNAIAKGQSVDFVANFLVSRKVENFLVEIGGEIMCKGKNPNGENWRIGIDKPIENTDYENRENQIIINISNKAVATSGNYRKFIENENKKYAHTINPKTGYPEENELLSVTVIAKDCMSADAYATAFMASGLEKSKNILKNLNNIEVYFIYLDNANNVQDYYTKNFEQYILK